MRNLAWRRAALGLSLVALMVAPAAGQTRVGRTGLRSTTRCSGRSPPTRRGAGRHRDPHGAGAAGPGARGDAAYRRRQRPTTVLDGERGFAGRSSRRRHQCSSPARRPCRCWRWLSGRRAPRRPGASTSPISPAARVRRQVGVATAEAYLSIVGAKRQVEVNERARDNAQAQLEYATARREGGVGSRLNELRRRPRSWRWCRNWSNARGWPCHLLRRRSDC